MYTTLQRLENKRLVATRLSEPRPERGGKPRRLVTVRPAGVAAVRATAGAIQAMVGGLNAIEDNCEVRLTKGERRVSPFLVPMMMANAAGAAVSMRYGWQGPV